MHSEPAYYDLQKQVLGLVLLWIFVWGGGGGGVGLLLSRHIIIIILLSIPQGIYGS